MIWKACRLEAKVEGDKDALGNPQVNWEKVTETKARTTPFDNIQTLLEQREVTSDMQSFAIPLRYEVFPECQRAVIDDRTYDIEEIIDLSPRYTVIVCKVYKS